MVVLVLLFVVCLLVAVALWFGWRQAVFERNELQKAVYEADKETGFVERMKPDHFVPSRHKVTFPGEVVSPYEDCRRYEVLRDAKMAGEFRQRR